MKFAPAVLCVAMMAGGVAHAQQTAPAPVAAKPTYPVREFFLRYANTQAEQNEVLTALRNIATPQLRVFLVPSQSKIVATGSPEDMKTIETMLAALDVAHKLYRVTYTFTESDGGKRIGLEKYSMTLASGQRMQMKQGSRIPLVTGGSKTDPGSQRTYLDVGLNFDSQVDEYGSGVRLKARVEQSSLAEEKSGVGPEDPIIRQTYVEGTTTAALGKPVLLGSLDVYGSTRHIEVSATVDQEPVQ
jgi:type II secretory pathway component GspD/PulD (secretin)